MLVFGDIGFVRRIKIDALAFYDQRTGANLVKDAKDVFADEAHEKQLHTGKEEERGDDQRGPPGNALAKGRKEQQGIEDGKANAEQ